MQLTTPTLKIAVLDRGFVYVGLCHTENGALVISNAHNIRRWGTTAGLGELAIKGPQRSTELDVAGTIHAPLTALIHLIDCAPDAWATTMAQAA
jgi:hypothetical protein